MLRFSSLFKMRPEEKVLLVCQIIKDTSSWIVVSPKTCKESHLPTKAPPEKISQVIIFYQKGRDRV